MFALVDTAGRGVPEVLRSVQDAVSGAYADNWRRAMIAKIESIRLFSVYTEATFEDGPDCDEVVPGQWVYEIGPQIDQPTTFKLKARWVARGNKLAASDLPDDLFSPVSDAVARRTNLSMFAREDLAVRQGDFKTAFLNAKLETPVFMTASPGSKTFKPDGTPLIWRSWARYTA